MAKATDFANKLSSNEECQWSIVESLASWAHKEILFCFDVFLNLIK
jgi:hypothetical protein